MTKTLKAIIFGVVAYIGTKVVIAIVAVVCMLWFMEDERIKSGYEYLFLCASCDKKDHIQEVSTHISPILDTISLDYAQYVNYRFQNYTRENIVFYIYHFSRDSSLYYNYPVICNATTGRVEEVHEPSAHVPIQGVYIPTPEEKAMYCAAINDADNIEQLLKPIIRFRETIGSSHIYYFYGAFRSEDKVSKHDFGIAFNDKGRYYLLTHFRDEDSIPAEEIRVTERWSIKEIEPPDYR